MSYLLDSNICSAYLRRPGSVFHRFMQHSGRLAISAVNLGELYTWAYKQTDPLPILSKVDVDDLLNEVAVLTFDAGCALRMGQIRGAMLQRGIVVSPSDLMIAATALVHGLTLVTHNVRDFANVPGLAVEDWLAP